MKPIRFTKMHGLGNDFVVINALESSFTLNPASIIQLANRHTGIGFDQILIIEPSKQADFFCRIYNSDGSEALQCGNGLRCVARFIHEEHLHTELAFSIKTKAGTYPILITDYDHIRVGMGPPAIEEKLVQLDLATTKKSIELSILSIGNPHAVIKVSSIDQIIADSLAQEISRSVYFPTGVNVGLMEIIDPKHIRLRTFERGAGETLACGSNACAAVVAGIVNGWLIAPIEVTFYHGSLWIDWEGGEHPIYMTGPASRVFNGRLSA